MKHEYVIWLSIGNSVWLIGAVFWEWRRVIGGPQDALKSQH